MPLPGEMPALENAPTPGAQMLERPFHFIVVLWGERFRNYFLDLCLPTLLSPRNLPALRTRQPSKFLICTRPEDWAALNAAPVFRLLEQHVEPVYVEIPPCPAGMEGGVHMGTGHRRGCELAYAAKAYPFVLTPDCIFADGTIARVQELAIEGVELALVPALRFAEEPLFEHLQQAGISPHGRAGIAAPITLANRELARMALASLHSETKSYEWDAPYFHPIPAAAWWHVPDEDGIVVHCLSWAPLLFDFAAVPAHDTSTFDNWTFDGDYIYKNLGNIKRIHLVLDSDEIFMASWAPSSDKPYDLSPQRLLARPLIGGFVKRHRFNRAFYKGFTDPFKQQTFLFDPLKQQIFFNAARWHARSINEKWAPVERRALKMLYSCVAPPDDEVIASLQRVRAREALNDPFPPRHQSRTERITNFLLSRFVRRVVQFICATAVAILQIAQVVQHLRIHKEAIIPRLRQVMQGDREVMRWLKWRIRELAYHLVGRTFHQGKPPRPNR
jgi:hypothetical protein